MRPIFQHELRKQQIADLHRQAGRGRMARAAGRPRQTKPE
jgi:hypothetical protein